MPEKPLCLYPVPNLIPDMMRRPATIRTARRRALLRGCPLKAAVQNPDGTGGCHADGEGDGAGQRGDRDVPGPGIVTWM